MDTLADRAWFAYHCLPVDHDGKLPSLRQLEIAYGLSTAMLSKVMHGKRTNHETDTIPKFAEALRCTVQFLISGEGRAPVLPAGRSVPARPGGRRVYGDVPGWDEAVTAAKARRGQLIPPEAYRAGADLEIFRNVPRMTPTLATWLSGVAWETSTPAQQTRYSTAEARTASAGQAQRASPLRRPAVK